MQKDVIRCVTSSAESRQCPRARARVLITSFCILVILAGEGGEACCNDEEEEEEDEDDEEEEEEEEEEVKLGNPSSLMPSVY